ncbi:hypothetical protein GCM10027443_18070 [Pontibacter brevis]
MKKQKVYKIRKSGTDEYLGYSKEEFSEDFSKQKVYVSEKSVKKVCDELTAKGYDVEVDGFELNLKNRKTVIADLVENL